MSIRSQRSRRRGSMLNELIVASFLLIATIGILSTGTVATKQLWQDTQHHQLALDELSNQLERLTALEPDEHQSAIDSLRPTEMILRWQPAAKLTATLIDDQDGQRISIQLQWPESERLPPLSLVAWLR